MRVEHFGDADILRADECGEPAQRFAETIWIAQRTFKKLELPPLRVGGLDAQPHRGRAVIELQAVEVRLQNAEEHVHVRRRRRHGEAAFVRASVGQ